MLVELSFPGIVLSNTIFVPEDALFFHLEYADLIITPSYAPAYCNVSIVYVVASVYPT